MQKIDNIIYKLKDKYDDIFYSKIKGEEFIFRPLSRFEYEELIVKRKIKDPILAEEICKKTVLYPTEYNFTNPHAAGVPESLSSQVIEKSGFSNPEFIDNLANKKQNQLNNNVFIMMENVILVAFPGLNLEKIKKFNIYELIDYYTRASWIIKNMYSNLQLPQQIPGENSKQNHNQKGLQNKQQKDPRKKKQPIRTMGDNLRNSKKFQ